MGRCRNPATPHSAPSGYEKPGAAMRISYTPIVAGIGLTGRTLVLTVDGVHTAANGAVTCQFSWRGGRTPGGSQDLAALRSKDATRIGSCSGQGIARRPPRSPLSRPEHSAEHHHHGGDPRSSNTHSPHRPRPKFTTTSSAGRRARVTISTSNDCESISKPGRTSAEQ
jgi:hypothetical protein